MSDEGRAGEFAASSLRALWRRRMLFLASAAVVIALTLVFLAVAPTRYASDAVVIVEPKQASVIEAIEMLVPVENRDRDLVRNHAAVLRSRSLAEKVIAELNLEDDPEFNTYRNADAGGADDEQMRSMREKALVLEVFDSALAVTTQSQSRVIKVRFTASTPEKAHAIVDSLVRHYLHEYVEAQSGVTRQAQSWLEDRMRSLRSKLDELDATIEEFQKKIGFIGEYDATLVTLSLFYLENSVAETSSRKALVKARIDAIDPAKGSSATRELRDEYDSLTASESAFKERKKALQQRLASINENGWRLEALLAEKEIVRPNATLISPASYPVHPSFPRARLLIVLAVVVSLFVGVLVVSVVETFGPAFRAIASE
jgi:succinoglycan biosynthesis transport protein ExoP